VVHSETRGAACWFANEYGDSPIEFPQFGINVTVLEPGQSGVYHAEANQEAFLVLAGVQAARRGRGATPSSLGLLPLASLDGARVRGSRRRPCAILMVGAHWARKSLPGLGARGALRASVEKETSDPDEVYATAEWFRRGRPPYWSRLPWGS
jgi:hypothetical protein